MDNILLRFNSTFLKIIKQVIKYWLSFLLHYTAMWMTVREGEINMRRTHALILTACNISQKMSGSSPPVVELALPL